MNSPTIIQSHAGVHPLSRYRNLVGTSLYNPQPEGTHHNFSHTSMWRRRPWLRWVLLSAVLVLGWSVAPVLAAGNVIAVEVDGRLRIQGDALGNRIYLARSRGVFDVRGISGTTINDAMRATVHGVTSDMVINLGDGGDSVKFSFGGPLQGNLVVQTGPGDDEVSFENAIVEGFLAIDTATGNDRIVFLADEGGAQVEGHVLLLTGTGDDVVELNYLSSGPVTLHTATGNDLVFLDMFTVEGRLLIHAGAGKDTVSFTREWVPSRASSIVLNGGSDADQVSFPATRSLHGNLTFTNVETINHQ